MQPTSILTLPMVEQCDCALRSFDSAISDEIVAGSVVFLKEIVPSAIIPARWYVIVTANYVLLRKVRFAESGSQPREYILESSGREDDRVTIKEDEIKTIYRVVANLKMY
jgi:hypothetical protein